MIRLIATDLDGTLLNDAKQLPADFDNMMQKLYEREIHFAVASGRSYATLKQQFTQYVDELAFICDNGAYIMYQQQLQYISLMDKEIVDELIDVCRSFDAKVLLCGKNGTYHEHFGTVEGEEEIAKYYVNQVVVEDTKQVEDDIFKLAVYDSLGAEEHAYPILKEHFGDKLALQVSGKYWMDIMNEGVTKGKALESIQQFLDVLPEETMAFGDYMNDYDMLLQAGESFAMENAHDNIKKVAKHVTVSNNENGVMKAIEEYVF